MSSGPATLREDQRARIPFAVIAVVLLLVSSTFVVQLETGNNRGPTLETDRAMDRTEAAVQTALADALADASEQAATRPLTDPASTEYGRKLAGSNGNDSFDRYLAALVYLNANEYFQTAGQQVGNVETTVEIPGISDPEEFGAAIDRVTVRPGIEHADLESGVVEVRLKNVSIVALREGEEIGRRTKTVSVAVATPLYQLHDRTTRFQERLDAGVTAPGFTQRFNARIYALGWARGYAQYAGAPITEVIANRHVVPAANDAVYRTQKDVFGAADPRLTNAVRRGWLCMALHDVEGLYSGFTGTDSQFGADLCKKSKWLFGDRATGELPDAPGTMELLGNAPGMGAEQTIGVNGTAYLPFQEMFSGSGEHSVDSIVDRIFELEVAVDDSFETVRDPAFAHDVPVSRRRGRSQVVETENEHTVVDVTDISEPEPADEYYEIDGEIRLRLSQTEEHVYRDTDGRDETTTTATGTRVIEFEIRLEEGEISPNANIDDHNRVDDEPLEIAAGYRYQQGPARHRSRKISTVPDGSDPAGFENYGDVGDEVLAAFFLDGSSPGSDDEARPGKTTIESTLEDAWEDAVTVRDLDFPSSKVVSLDPPDGGDLERTIATDLADIRKEASEITHSFERRDVLHDGNSTGPYGKLIDTVDREKREYLDRDEPYANVGQKVIYEARYSYFERLTTHLGRFESAHGRALDKIDAKLPDLGLGQALSYLQEGVTATPPDPVSLESPSMTGDLSYEVSGSPTYLVAESVTTEEVPAVENDIDAFGPMAARTRNYLKLPYDSITEGLIGRIANRLDLDEPAAKLTFWTAGELLRAGELASDAARDGRYGDSTRLGRLTGRIEAGVETALTEFQRKAAKQIAFRLYPNDVVTACARNDCSKRERSRLESATPGTVECSGTACTHDFERPGECTSTLCALEEGSTGETALPEIRRAIETTVTDDSTATTASELAGGELGAPIAAAVTERLSDGESRPEYARQLSAKKWESIVRSATESAVRSVANEGAVTVSNAENVAALDREVRRTLGNVTADLTRDRFENRLDGTRFDPGEYDEWVDGIGTPIRVPAGMALLPFPNLWFATVNVWDVEVEGEYARFEVSTDAGTPDGAGRIGYVREDELVDVEIAGERRRLGAVEPIRFSGRSVLVVVVPPGGIGVGDRDGEDPECSPTWPVTGEIAGARTQCDAGSHTTDDRETRPGIARGTETSPSGALDVEGRPWR